MEKQLLKWARTIKAISQTGIAYQENIHDQNRYKELHQLSLEMLSYISLDECKDDIKKIPIESGYATPKVAVRAVIFQDNQLLMVKEMADGLWSLPGGWCDIGETPSENIEKEVLEETGLRVNATKVLAVYDQTKYNPSITLQHIYTVYFKCEIINGQLTTSQETSDIGFFPLNDLPPLSTERMTPFQLRKAIEEYENESPSIYFD